MAEELQNEKVDVEQTEPVKTDEPKTDEVKTFTQEELDDIISKRVMREREIAKKSADEAKKLAKMNSDQKQQYELEKLQEERDSLKKQVAIQEMSNEASNMLSESKITPNQGILDMVVRDTAEDTKEAVNSFIEIVTKTADNLVTEKLKGTPPKISSATKISSEKTTSIKDIANKSRLI